MIKKIFEVTVIGDVEDVSYASETIMDALTLADLASFEVICNSEKVEVVDNYA